MRSTTWDITFPSGLCAALEWIEHIQMLYAQHHIGYNISKGSMRRTTVDRTSPIAPCAAPQWIEHLQMVDAQYNSAQCAVPRCLEQFQMFFAQYDSGWNISKCSMHSTTVDRTSKCGLCAASEWIEHHQMVDVQHHSA